MKAFAKILTAALLVMTVTAPPAIAKTLGANFDWTVKNIKLSIAGPVVIHSNSNKPRVKVTLSGAEAKKLRIAHDSHTLELTGNAQYKNYTPRVEKVEIWTDGLRSVSVYGASDVDLGTVEDNALDIRLYGKGTIRAKHIDTTGTSFMLYGLGRMEIDRLDATGVQFALAGQGEIVVREQDVTTINAILSGIGNMDLGTVDATNVDINLSGQGNIKIAGDATTARLFTGGVGNIDSYGLKTVRTISTVSPATSDGQVSTSTSGMQTAKTGSDSTQNGIICIMPERDKTGIETGTNTTTVNKKTNKKNKTTTGGRLISPKGL